MYELTLWDCGAYPKARGEMFPYLEMFSSQNYSLGYNIAHTLDPYWTLDQAAHYNTGLYTVSVLYTTLSLYILDLIFILLNHYSGNFSAENKII